MTRADLDNAISTYNAARELARREPTSENRDAVKAAWIEKERIAAAVLPPRKVAAYASRAGQRQHGEFWSQYRR